MQRLFFFGRQSLITEGHFHYLNFGLNRFFLPIDAFGEWDHKIIIHFPSRLSSRSYAAEGTFYIKFQVGSFAAPPPQNPPQTGTVIRVYVVVGSSKNPLTCNCWRCHARAVSLSLSLARLHSTGWVTFRSAACRNNTSHPSLSCCWCCCCYG